MSSKTCIVWFRRDLRLSDNPALRAAVDLDCEVIPLFIWDDLDDQKWGPGAASKWWLHHSLKSLSESIKKAGSELIIKKGNAATIIEEVAKESNANFLFWNRLYDPDIVRRDKEIKLQQRAAGIQVVSYNSSLAYEPFTIQNKQGTPYKVFTPFWKALRERPEPDEPCPTVRKINGYSAQISSVTIKDLELLPSINWADEIDSTWNIGESAAKSRLNRFLKSIYQNYSTDRDIPSVDGTSRMSPYLHFGEIGPRQIWHETRKTMMESDSNSDKKEGWAFLREIAWREFSHHLLYHFPEIVEKPLRKEFEEFRWDKDKGSVKLKSWQNGMTGYPIVDAGMRQLWRTGWMHNRVRMIVGSFLVKDLKIHWMKGDRWFWDTLVDADLANNTFGWQWIAGCGADAAPYFRIFNPVTQGERFDPEGKYIREFIPELKQLPNKYIHKPWEASEVILEDANVILGETYPNPIVDHQFERDDALARYKDIKKS